MSATQPVIGLFHGSRTTPGAEGSARRGRWGAAALAAILFPSLWPAPAAAQGSADPIVLEHPRVEVFFDFNAAVDGDGSEANPYNRMTPERSAIGVTEPDQHVYVWLEGEVDALAWPAGVHVRAEPIAPGASPASLNMLSRHLVEPDAARGHVTWSVAVEPEKMRIRQHLPGIFRVDLPFDREQTGVAGVLRDYREPEVTPIPPDGLPDGVAMNTGLVESYRLGPMPRVAVREAQSFADLRARRHGWWLDRDRGRLFIKTKTGLPPGSPAVPEWRVVVERSGPMLSVNDFGSNTAPRVRVGGLTMSFAVEGPDPGFRRSRVFMISPATETLVHDILFMFCGSEDAVAAVNGGGPDHRVVVRRNQYVGVPRDGGPAVVATQRRKPPYASVQYSDFVVHGGYTLRYEDGAATGLLPYKPVGVLGTYHLGNVEASRLDRAIGLSYDGFSAPMFQFSPIDKPADPRDRGMFRAVVSDVHAERVFLPSDFSAAGVRVERSYFSLAGAGLSREHGVTLWESCVFEADSGPAVLGQIVGDPVAFSNCLVRYHGGDSTVSLFGVSDPGLGGRAYVRDLIVDLGGQAAGMRFATGSRRAAAPPVAPEAVLGWDDDDPDDGVADLGRHLFDRGMFFEPDAGGELTVPSLDATLNPIDAGPSDSVGSFLGGYGGGIALFETSMDPAFGADLEAMASLAHAIAGGTRSAYPDGPVGIDGAPYAGAIGPFQAFAASPCRIADADASGSVDVNDLMVFIDRYLAGTPDADLNADMAVDSTDLFAFFAAYSDPACR